MAGVPKTFLIQYRGLDAYYSVLWHFFLDHLFTLYRIFSDVDCLDSSPQILIRGIQPGKTDRLVHFYRLLTPRPVLLNEATYNIPVDYDLGQVMGSGPWEDGDSLTYLSLSDRPKCLSGEDFNIQRCYANFRKQDPSIAKDLKAFRRHVLKGLSVSEIGAKGVLLVKRKNSNIYGRKENRAYRNEAELKEGLSGLGVRITDVYLEDLLPEEQIKLVASHLILICPIGSSSTLSIFLPPGGKLILIFPADLIYPLSRILCDNLDLQYEDFRPNQNNLSSASSKDRLDDELKKFENLLKDPALFSCQLNRNLDVPVSDIFESCQAYLQQRNLFNNTVKGPLQ